MNQQSKLACQVHFLLSDRFVLILADQEKREKSHQVTLWLENYLKLDMTSNHAPCCCRRQNNIRMDGPATILFIIFWHFLIIQLRFELPQLKQYLITSITNLVHGCLTSCQTIQDLGSYEIKKYQKNVKWGWRRSLVPSLLSRN